jgi:ABC-type dipeptide/oligopeptide/nickel transport system permease subunit
MAGATRDGVLAAPLPPAVALRVQAGRGQLAWRFLRRNPLSLLGLVLVLLTFVLVLAAPIIAPFDPLEQNIRSRMQPPGPVYLFGTDGFGRDVLSRVLYGGRLSLPLALVVVAGASVVGTIAGAFAGYRGGVLDEIVMRLADLVLAFPSIILAMAVVAALGGSMTNSVIAVAIVHWPRYARIVRSLVLGIKQLEYVTAARVIAASDTRILFRAVLPNAIAPTLVLATMEIGGTILTLASLSFLGLGSPPPTPEWGKMVAEGAGAFDQWWIGTFPGLAILLVVMGFNFLGDGIRDVMDPRLRTGE